MAVLITISKPVILILAGLLFVCALGLLLFLIPELSRFSKVQKLNAGNSRDAKYASGILSLYYPENVIKNPYLLKTDADCPPNADVLVVCRGGIAIISVADRPGYYRTPQTGVWTVTTENDVTRMPNLFERGMNYVKSASAIAKRAGVVCPIYNLALLSDDGVEFDAGFSEGVITSDGLISCFERIDATKKISKKDVRVLIDAINTNSNYCRSVFTRTPENGSGNGENGEND